ncbi:MAG: ABC transporter permease [bacterium]|nr:ABC transporter permease [bacterium]
MSILTKDIVAQIFTRPFRIRPILHQMVVVGLNTLPIASIMAIFTGMVLAVQTYYQFRQFDLETYIGTVVGLSMTRELGPVLTAIIVAGRIGSSTAAEIGSMKVTEQIDALRTFGVNPVRYLATPRFIALVTMLPFLTIYTDFIGILGAYSISIIKFHIRSSLYIDKTIHFLDPPDVLSGLIKAIFFGAIIAIVSCHKGLTSGEGAQGVGRATTNSVVLSSILILIIDYFLTIILP